MIITVTERQEYKRCRRRWNYGSWNRLAIAPIIPKVALNTGRLIHQTLADWTLEAVLPPEKRRDIEAILVGHAKEVVAEAKRAYRSQVGMEMSEDELGSVYDAIGLSRTIALNYAAHWKTPLPKKFRLVAPEQTCVVPIPGTPHFLEGTLDGILLDDKDLLWVLERKTYGQRPRKEVLDSSDQFLAYVWLLRQLGLGPVGGIAYDGMWKHELTKSYKLDDLFFRTLLVRGLDELAEFEANLAAEAMEMASDPPLYINRRWEGCLDCDYERLCLATSKGEDVHYVYTSYYTKRVREPDRARPQTIAEVTMELSKDLVGVLQPPKEAPCSIPSSSIRDN